MELDLFALLEKEEVRLALNWGKEYILGTTLGVSFAIVALCLASILVLSKVSSRIEDYCVYLKSTRYRGRLVCVGGRALDHHGVPLNDHLYRRDEPIPDLPEPHVLATRLDDGRCAFLVVSPYRYRNTRVGTQLSGRWTRNVLRWARVVF